MVRAEIDHLDARLQALVTRLSSVPGLDVTVSYHCGRLRRFLGDLPYINDLNRKKGPIQRIEVAAGRRVYWLHRDAASLRCGRDPDPSELSFSAWAKELFGAIAEQNLVQHDSLVALRQLVEHDLVG